MPGGLSPKKYRTLKSLILWTSAAVLEGYVSPGPITSNFSVEHPSSQQVYQSRLNQHFTKTFRHVDRQFLQIVWPVRIGHVKTPAPPAANFACDNAHLNKPLKRNHCLTESTVIFQRFSPTQPNPGHIAEAPPFAFAFPAARTFALAPRLLPVAWRALAAAHSAGDGLFAAKKSVDSSFGVAPSFGGFDKHRKRSMLCIGGNISAD